MKTSENKMPWWLVTITGVLIVIASILLLISPVVGLSVLTFLVGFAVLIYGVYNIYKALRSKYDNNAMIPYLVHGLLDIVLLLLILVIKDTPALLGIIIACWFIVFGVFEMILAKQDDEGNKRKARIGALLMLIGIGLILIPMLLHINYVLLFAIVALVFGIIRTAQGIIFKVNIEEHTSSGRSNLI